MSTQIKRLREKSGMTQEQLSEAANVPLSTLRGWEQKGRNIRNMQRLIPIADVLGCSVDDLVGREMVEQSHFEDQQIISTSNKQTVELTNDEQSLVCMFRKLNDPCKSKLLDFAKMVSTHPACVKQNE